MEEQPCSRSDTKLSESWTLVTGENSEHDSANCDIEETSDAESLEVLEVEQADPEQNTEDNSGSEIPCDEALNENNCIHEMNFPIFHIVAAHKTKKYVHHPNPYINMWLSIMMVVAIAITLGLGMGHYLGTRRFSKATDIIQHLQCKNHILEMEFSKLAAKHKTCERNLHDTENIFNTLMSSSNEVEFPVEEKIVEEDLPRLNDFNKLNSITPLQFESGEKGDLGLSFEKICFFNQNFSNTARMKGDQTINHMLFSNTVRENSKNLLTPIVHKSFANLKAKLSSLHSLLKKWSQYISNIHYKSTWECRENNDYQDHSNATEYPQNTSCKSINNVNNAKTNYEHPYIFFNTSAFTSSHNDCYRSQFNLCKRCEDELELSRERNKLSGSMHHFPLKENKPHVLGYFPEIVHKINPFIFDSNSNNWESKNTRKQETFRINRYHPGEYNRARNFGQSKFAKFQFKKTHSQIKKNKIDEVSNNGGMFERHKFNCIKNGHNYKCSHHAFLGKQNYEPQGKGDIKFTKSKIHYQKFFSKKDSKNKISKKHSKGPKGKKLNHEQGRETQHTFRKFITSKKNKAKSYKSKENQYIENNFSFNKYAVRKIKRAMNYGENINFKAKVPSHKDFKSIKKSKYLNKDSSRQNKGVNIKTNTYGSQGFESSFSQSKNNRFQKHSERNSRMIKKQKDILLSQKEKKHHPLKQVLNAFKY